MLDYLLFNIFINDSLFLSAKCEFCYFTDDDSLYSCGTNLDNIFTSKIRKRYMNGFYTVQ